MHHTYTIQASKHHHQQQQQLIQPAQHDTVKRQHSMTTTKTGMRTSRSRSRRWTMIGQFIFSCVLLSCLVVAPGKPDPEMESSSRRLIPCHCISSTPLYLYSLKCWARRRRQTRRPQTVRRMHIASDLRGWVRITTRQWTSRAPLARTSSIRTRTRPAHSP